MVMGNQAWQWLGWHNNAFLHNINGLVCKQKKPLAIKMITMEYNLLEISNGSGSVHHYLLLLHSFVKFAHVELAAYLSVYIIIYCQLSNCVCICGKLIREN